MRSAASARHCARHKGQEAMNTPRQTRRRDAEDVRREYCFDYSRAKPQSICVANERPVVAVVLDSGVAPVFDSSAKVNAQLRSAIAARKRRKPAKPARAVLEGRVNNHQAGTSSGLGLTGNSLGSILTASSVLLEHPSASRHRMRSAR